MYDNIPGATNTRLPAIHLVQDISCWLDALHQPSGLAEPYGSVLALGPGLSVHLTCSITPLKIFHGTWTLEQCDAKKNAKSANFAEMKNAK